MRAQFAESRKFNGKIYYLYTSEGFKSDAKRVAWSLGGGGNLARVVTNTMIGGRQVYLIYYRRR